MSEQIIVFELEEQLYGIDIHEVGEISSVLPMTSIPSQNKVEGMVDIRGSIHYVISLRKSLGLPSKENDETSKLIVLREGKVALLADKVTTMVTIEADKKQSMKNISMFGGQNTLSYVAKWNDTLVTVIDVQSMLQQNQAISTSQ